MRVEDAFGIEERGWKPSGKSAVDCLAFLETIRMPAISYRVSDNFNLRSDIDLPITERQQCLSMKSYWML
jgi:hypothetical protein